METFHLSFQMALPFFVRSSICNIKLAWTEFYKSGKNINPSTVNWKYCYVKIYKTNFNKLTKNGRKGTIAHEAGHAFGLAHNQGNPKSIMCQTKYGRAVSSAQICDLKGINHLYK